MNRRFFPQAIAICGVAVPAALSLAACAPTTTSTGTTTQSNVQKVLGQIQFVLPLVDVLLAGVAVAIPSAAPAITAAEPFLAAAGQAFQSISATMTDMEAKPIVQQVEGYVAGALKAISGVIAGNASLAPLSPKLAQAQAVLVLLDAFVTGVSVMPTAAAVPVPYLHR